MRISEFEFEEETLEKVKEECRKEGTPYIINESDDNSDDFVQFLFTGKHNGKEALFDAALYTLQLHHESELYDMAERHAMKKFPEYRDLMNRGVEIREGLLPAAKEEEIGLFMMETMEDLEEDEAVKVKEYVEVDEDLDFRVGLDICLNVDAVTPAVIEKFIAEYSSGTLKLDPTLYSFMSEDEGE